MAQGQPFTQQSVEQLVAEQQFGLQNSLFMAGHSQVSTINGESAAGPGRSQGATETMSSGNPNYTRSPAFPMETTCHPPMASSDVSAYSVAQHWPDVSIANNFPGVQARDLSPYLQELANLRQGARQQPTHFQSGQPQAIGFGQSSLQNWQQLHQQQQCPQQYYSTNHSVYFPPSNTFTNQYASAGSPVYPITAAQPSLQSPSDGSSFPTQPPASAAVDQSFFPERQIKRPAQLDLGASESVDEPPVKTAKRNNNHRSVKQPAGSDKAGTGKHKPRKSSASASRRRGNSVSTSIGPDIVLPKLVAFMSTNDLTMAQVKEAIRRAEDTMLHGGAMATNTSRGHLPIAEAPRSVELSPAEIMTERQRIFKIYGGYQKESRPKERTREHKYKCTLGCRWSHRIKSNWERHECTHYPPEIWLCEHRDCFHKPHKTRVSFRKDLARRHYADHHCADPGLSEQQLEDIKHQLTESQFPRECVFLGCDQKFETFDDRKIHIVAHLKNSDILERERIVKNHADVAPGVGSDEDGEADFRDQEEEDEDDNEDDYDRKDDNDSNDDDDDDDDDDDNQDSGTGGAAGQGGDPGHGHSGGGSYSHPSNTRPKQQPSQNHNTRRGYAGQRYDIGPPNNESMLTIDKRPWKTTKQLRLHVLPQVFARGIAQTPIVLKKIQLQAALLLDLSSIRRTQVVNALRHEIAMMASVLPSSPGPSINRFPRLTAMTKLLPDLAKSVSKFDMSSIAKQNQAILKFAGLRKDILSQELEDPGGLISDPLHERLAHFEGGHIYHFFSMQLSATVAPIRPTRLLHVGTKKDPKLHLDTSEVLPSSVDYCSLSHCWDDGYGLFLSTKNVASLKHAIPAEDLTQSFHVAINIARDKGLEYLWVDTLCIMLDSDEDVQAEAPRITQIHASATFSIIVTSVAYDGDVLEPERDESTTTDGDGDWNEKAEEPSEPDMSDLALNRSVEMVLPDELDQNSDHAQSEESIILRPPQRRDSHQLESYLAEPSKRSFFYPFPLWNKTSLTLSSLPAASLSEDQMDTDRAADAGETSSSTFDKRLSQIEKYLKKWRIQWQKSSPSSKSAPVSSAASSITSSSPAPSISDTSIHSGKRRSLMGDLPVAFEKLFRGLRIRPHQHRESSTPDG